MSGPASYMNSDDWRLEKMFMVVPNNIKELYGENLLHNEKSIVTPWDFHTSLLHLGRTPKNDKNNFGKSILHQIDNERFSCR